MNELRTANFYFVKAHTKKGSHVPEPKVIRRPVGSGEQDRKRPFTAEELARALGKGPGVIRYTPKTKG